MGVREGTVALVTGGGKGVGAGIARVLCAQGARVCIGCNTNLEMAEHTLEGIRRAGGEAFLYQADVSDRGQLRAMVRAAVDRYGRLDALVNNAALQPNRYIRDYDAETMERLWNINIGGYWRATQECLPYLKESPCGRVVNVSSVHGKRPTVFDIGYAMTKGAIRMFTREAAIELAGCGVTVNQIYLGACKIEGKTGHFSFRLTHEADTHVVSTMPTGSIPVPEDVGHLVSYLISPEAGSVTGAGIRLDAGSMLI